MPSYAAVSMHAGRITMCNVVQSWDVVIFIVSCSRLTVFLHLLPTDEHGF